MKMIKTLVQVSLLTVSSVAMATQVNITHFAPFADELDATAVAVNVNGTEIVTGVTYRQASGYKVIADAGVEPGNSTIEVFTPPGSTTATITSTVNLAADTNYTVLATGDGSNQPLGLMSLVDDNSPPAAGNSKVRIVHASPFSSNLSDTTVSIRTDEGDIINGLIGLEYGDSSGYFELEAGTYDLNVSTPDGSTRLIDLAPVTLNVGDIITLYAIGDGVNQPLGIFATFGDGSGADIPLELPFFTLNPGLNGAWYNQDTNGQGFFVEVYPVLGTVFVAWFTFDTTFADAGETAVVGDSNHRWYTAQGEYNGTSADLTLYLSTGGIFDQSNAVNTAPAGTLNIEFENCSRANVQYSIDGSGLTGEIPLTRVSGSTVAFCESLPGRTGE